jgi:hypothetical protein
VLPADSKVRYANVREGYETCISKSVDHSHLALSDTQISIIHRPINTVKTECINLALRLSGAHFILSI